jgi:hypothetical protein
VSAGVPVVAVILDSLLNQFISTTLVHMQILFGRIKTPVKIDAEKQTRDGILLLISNAALGNPSLQTKSLVKYSTIFSISAVVGKDVCALPQFLQANVRITPQIRP